MTLPRRMRGTTMRLGTLAAVLAAGCASPESNVRDIDPRADTAFRNMCQTLDMAKAMRFRVHATMDGFTEMGSLAQFHRTSEVTLARPDRLFAETASDDGRWAVWHRDKSLTLLDRDSNAYATETVPRPIDEMLDHMADNYDLIMPMADLLVGDTYRSMIENVESGTYVGLHEVDDIPCHHLLFMQEDIDWQIWIDARAPHLPRKLAITYVDEPDQPQYVALIDAWDLAPAVTEDVFVFAPPSGAVQAPMTDLVAED